MKGVAVGAKPIFDGICSQCGTLLHGFLGNHSALSNKVAGPPLDRDGALLVEEDGSPKVNAQPPCLLRFSPSLFAKEAPAMFKHDEETNRLSLQEGRREPWLRVEHHSQTSAGSAWLYCRDCVDRYFDTGKRAHGHLPYRDRASQSLMRRPQEKERVQTETQEPSQEEPEHESESPEKRQTTTSSMRKTKHSPQRATRTLRSTRRDGSEESLSIVRPYLENSAEITLCPFQFPSCFKIALMFRSTS